MLTIGFTTQYYTLWNVNSFMKSKLDRGEIRWFLCTEYQYLRNLSIDLEKAKEKVMSLGPNTEFNIALNLHGTKWFVEEKEVHVAGQEHDYTFTFGHMKGQDIRIAGNWITEHRARIDEQSKIQPWLYTEDDARRRDSEDTKYWKDVAWQLNRAMQMESTHRRKVYARRRLIELGELIRRNWIEKIPIFEHSDDPETAMQYREVVRKWMPKSLAKWHDEIGSKQGLFYADKERRQLTIKQVKSKMMPSAYGTLYIVDYLDSNGHIVTYKGGTPIQPPEEGQPFKVTATIKHVITPRGQKTFIQRIKSVAHA